MSATSAVSTSFAYGAAGNGTLYTDGNGGQWWDTYNSWGLQESRVEPFTTAYTTAANSTFTTAYDADQNPVTLTEPGGVTVTDTYNNLGELTGQSDTGAAAATPTRTFGYDTAGNLTSASTSNTASSGSNATSESLTYNDRRQVLTASGSAGSTSYGYNGDGQVASVADAAGTTSYSYDTAGRLATLADPATGTTAAYTYNPDSQVTAISYGTGNDTQSLVYDARHRLTSDTLKTSTVASVSYGYNADSEITSQITTGLAGASSNSYTYDQAGRLASWNNGTATTAYGYDGNGNLTTDGAKSYTYAMGRLVADTATGGPGYQFSYVGKTGAIASDGTSAYTWDPSGSTLVAAGAPGGGTGGTLALTDAHGDVTGQFTAAGATVSGSQAYDPWGSLTATTGTMTGMLGFQSAWTDPASGKDLMGARWYSPAAGDFTSADTLQFSPVPDPAAASPFAYAADEPLDNTDPSGHHIVLDSGDYSSNPRAAAGLQVAIGQTSERNYQASQAERQAAAARAIARKSPTRANKAAAARAARQARDLRGEAQAARQREAAAGKALDQAEKTEAARRKATTALNPKDKPNSTSGTGTPSWQGPANAATTYDGIPGALYSAYAGRACTSDLRFRSMATWSAKQNLKAGSYDQSNMERYGGPVPTSQLKDNVAFARGRLREAAGVSRLGLPTGKVGWGIAIGTTVASGVVSGYEEYQSTGNLGEAAAVGGPVPRTASRQE